MLNVHRNHRLIRDGGGGGGGGMEVGGEGDSVHNWFLYPVSHGGYFRMTDLDREKLKRVYACVFGVCVSA